MPELPLDGLETELDLVCRGLRAWVAASRTEPPAATPATPGQPETAPDPAAWREALRNLAALVADDDGRSLRACEEALALAPPGQAGRLALVRGKLGHYDYEAALGLLKEIGEDNE
jgi:hypothetical protein